MMRTISADFFSSKMRYRTENSNVRCYIPHGMSWVSLLGVSSDLLVLNVDTMVWTNLSSNSRGNAPSPRCCHGFTSSSGKLFVQGGVGNAGELFFVEFQFLFSELFTRIPNKIATNYEASQQWPRTGFNKLIRTCTCSDVRRSAHL